MSEIFFPTTFRISVENLLIHSAFMESESATGWTESPAMVPSPLASVTLTTMPSLPMGEAKGPSAR